jgi:hypothetical protein
MCAMFRGLSLLVSAAVLSTIQLRAVEIISSDTFNTTAPTDANIAGWETGWNAGGITGSNYVGSDNGASGVYLGDGFVLTAGHVGPNNFILDGQTYDVVAGSGQQIGTADLSLFRISTTSTTGNVLTLPTLTLALDAPTAFSSHSQGSSVVMIGYGGSHGETWGEDNINYVDQVTPLTVGVTVYNSLDFYTVNGTSTAGFRSITNNAELVPGDSGGGDFIFNATTDKWELAGINEVQLENDSGAVVGSGMVQLDNYSAIIEADMVPEPAAWQLLGLGLVLCAGANRLLRRRSMVTAQVNQVS